MRLSHLKFTLMAGGLFLNAGLGLEVDETEDPAFGAAETLLQEAYEADDRTSAFQRAEDALAKLAEASDETRKQAEFFVLKGYILEILEKPDQALAAFARAEKLDPEDGRPVYMQGQVHLYQERPEAALPFFERAVKLDPEDADWHYALAYAVDELGRFSDAEKVYRRVLELDPEYVMAKRKLGAVLASLGRYSDALPIWQHYVEADEKDLIAHWNLAQTWQSLEKHENAEKEFPAYRKKDPDYWRSLEKLCQVYEALGKTGPRDKTIEKIYELRRSENVPADLADKVLFIRDQFMLDGLRVFGIEYFELKGERALKYSFTAYRELAGEEREFINKISLGSYETTTQVSRELGRIGKDERIYHLDMYPPGGSHYTLGFYEKNPGYDAVKKLAIQGFRDKLEPLSATIVPASKEPDSTETPAKE